MTKEEALNLVNEAPFPAAKDGDGVLFEGYWFLMIDGKWEIDNSKDHPIEKIEE